MLLVDFIDSQPGPWMVVLPRRTMAAEPVLVTMASCVAIRMIIRRFWKVWKWTTKTHLPVTKTEIGATISVFVAGRAAGAAPTGGILNSSGEHEGFYYFLSIAKAKDNV